MPPGEVIDLSLSTDDEAAPRRASVQEKSSAPKTLAHNGFVFLEDDFDSTVHLDESWMESALKRRKTSFSPEEQNGPLKTDQALQGGQGATLGKAAYQGTSRTIQKNALNKEAHSIHSSALDLTPPSKPTSMLESIAIMTDESDDSFPEDIIHGSIRQVRQGPGLSERTAALLASFEEPAKRKRTSGERRKLKENSGSCEREPQLSTEELDLEDNKISKVGKPSGKTKLTEAERAARAEEKGDLRIATKIRKEKEKKEQQERKLLLKEEKAHEKLKAAALVEVNRSKMDKKITGPDMIVDLPTSIDGNTVEIQIREFLRNLQIEATSYQSPLPNMIKWRRKVKSRYNPEKEHWEPIQPMEIEDEKHVMCLMSAQEFVALASTQSPQIDDPDLEAHVLKLRGKFEGCTPIYLIEGLTSWMRKNKTTLNRAYQAAVLTQMGGQENGGPRGNQKTCSRRKKSAHTYVDEDMIEDALLRLQVIHKCLVHHTMNSMETAEWVTNFTQHISTIPAR